MIYNIEHIKDSIGNNYLGIKIPNTIVDPFLKDLRDHLSEEDYATYTDLQKKRDGGYHITVINVMDYNKLSKEMGISEFTNSIELLFKFPIDDIKMMGLGSATKNENVAYFIVVNSEKLNSVRVRYELPEHDFHITIGFKWKDVFGVRKNELLKSRSKFLKLLGSEFYKNENFNFLKRIPNFKGDPNLDIVPISISDNYLKILSGDITMDIGILDDPERLWVMTSYKSGEGAKRLPQTEIIRILKNNK